MTHRADQIVVAVADALSTIVTPKGSKVFKHRGESLDARQDELPAYSVDYGEDQPAEHQPLRGINSTLALVINAVVSAPTEGEVREKLLEMRDETDAILDAQMHGDQPKFGLSFVYGIGYGGAGAPEINTDGEACFGSLSTTWNFGYRLR